MLQLRGVPVIANDLALDAARPGLVLTGPNTGGKTIAMKTLGLAALMVRAGIPVPAAPEDPCSSNCPCSPLSLPHHSASDPQLAPRVLMPPSRQHLRPPV